MGIKVDMSSRMLDGYQMADHGGDTRGYLKRINYGQMGNQVKFFTLQQSVYLPL
jgi:hypothetical protein